MIPDYLKKFFVDPDGAEADLIVDDTSDMCSGFNIIVPKTCLLGIELHITYSFGPLMNREQVFSFPPSDTSTVFTLFAAVHVTVVGQGSRLSAKLDLISYLEFKRA